MSNLLVQNIKHTNNTTSMSVDTSGQVTIRGESSATTTNLQQGLAKAWVHYTQVSTQAIQDSLNISSITDTDTGKTTVSINNDMANNDYCAVPYQNGAAGTGAGDWNYRQGGLTVRQTGSVNQISYNPSGLVDSQLIDISFHGDLA
jgi:hypothetical protein